MNDPANDNQVSLFDELCCLTPGECEQELWVMLEDLREQNERAKAGCATQKRIRATVSCAVAREALSRA